MLELRICANIYDDKNERVHLLHTFGVISRCVCMYYENEAENHQYLRLQAEGLKMDSRLYRISSSDVTSSSVVPQEVTKRIVVRVSSYFPHISKETILLRLFTCSSETAGNI